MMANQPPVGSDRWRLVGLVAAVFLGLVFLVAAYGKVLDPAAFAEQISFEKLDFALPAGLLAWAVIVLEVFLGASLVFDLRKRWVLVPTGLLIVFFIFLTGRAYLRWTHGELDDTSACGCFGNLVERTPAEALWQDIVLLVPAFVLVWLLPKSESPARRRLAAVAIVTLLAGCLAWLSPILPVDDLATRLKVGARIDEFCAGSSEPGAERVCLDLLVPELLEGRHLVAIDRLDSPDIETTVDTLDAHAALLEGPAVWLLADADDERVQAFFWQWGPHFEVREAPLAMLRPLYRTLPRGLEVEDGTVIRTWAELPGIGGSAVAGPAHEGERR